MKSNFQKRDKVFMYSNIVLTLFCGVYRFNNNYDNKVINDVNNNVTISEKQEIKEEDIVVVKVDNKVNAQIFRREVNNNYKEPLYDEVLGKEISNYAQTFLKLSYVSGGYSLKTGTDCCGFTKLIYANYGIDISRSLYTQSKQGKYVSKSDLKEGDLVFYGYGDHRLHHVGIYIGNGKVIHAADESRGVIISSVDMLEYLTARRMMNKGSIDAYHLLVDSKVSELDSNIDTDNSNELDNNVDNNNSNEIDININNNSNSNDIITDSSVNTSDSDIIVDDNTNNNDSSNDTINYDNNGENN